MIKVGTPVYTPPNEKTTPLQETVYKTLSEQNIEFLRVDCEPAITMEDCLAIDSALKVKTVKTLLLCNRQQTEYYLFVTLGDKPFKTKNFSAALGISRVSFAPVDELNKKLGTELGATTVFSALSHDGFTLVIDEDALKDEWYGCTDGTTTGYMKIKTADLLNKVLPLTNHKPVIISLPLTE